MLKDNWKDIFIMVLKFFAIYYLCYYFSLAIIGLSSKEGRYSYFISHYLNFIDWTRSSLMYGTKKLLSFFHIETFLVNKYYLKKIGGKGFTLVFECVGYGIMSFWTAFIFTMSGAWNRKIIFWVLGMIIFWMLNVIRLSLFLVAINEGWPMPLGIDHHSWYNLITYSVMFLLIFIFEFKYNKRTHEKK